MLSPYCEKIRQKYGIIIGQVLKLIPTLGDKKKVCTSLPKFEIISRSGIKAKESTPCIEIRSITLVKGIP